MERARHRKLPPEILTALRERFDRREMLRGVRRKKLLPRPALAIRNRDRAVQAALAHPYRAAGYGKCARQEGGPQKAHGHNDAEDDTSVLKPLHRPSLSGKIINIKFTDNKNCN